MMARHSIADRRAADPADHRADRAADHRAADGAGHSARNCASLVSLCAIRTPNINPAAKAAATIFVPMDASNPFKGRRQWPFRKN